MICIAMLQSFYFILLMLLGFAIDVVVVFFSGSVVVVVVVCLLVVTHTGDCRGRLLFFELLSNGQLLVGGV